MSASAGAQPDPSQAAESLVDRVHRLVAEKNSATDGAALRASVARIIDELDPLLGAREASGVASRVLARIEGVGPLHHLFADAEVTDIMVNGPDEVWIERSGQVERVDVGFDRAAIERLIERTVSQSGRRVDPGSPMVDSRLADGSRVNVIVPPLALDGPCVTIRRFGATAIDIAAMCPPGVIDLLRWAVAARMNILISGGTGAGKTTFLNGLAAEIGDGERIVTIEDSAELRLPVAHVVRLESRPPNIEGRGEVTIRELVRNALRMRPDRIIVGEVRGAEALDMLWAMNTGHEGSLSTVHANSPTDVLRRLQVMALAGDAALPLWAADQQIGSAVDLIVQVSRQDGERRVVDVGEVVPVDRHWECRSLIGEHGLASLPSRPARSNRSAAPRAQWCRPAEARGPQC